MEDRLSKKLKSELAKKIPSQQAYSDKSYFPEQSSPRAYQDTLFRPNAFLLGGAKKKKPRRRATGANGGPRHDFFVLFATRGSGIYFGFTVRGPTCVLHTHFLLNHYIRFRLCYAAKVIICSIGKCPFGTRIAGMEPFFFGRFYFLLFYIVIVIQSY